MTKRQVVIDALEFRTPAYVPWDWGPTQQCAARLKRHLRGRKMEAFLDNHFVTVGGANGRWESQKGNFIRDVYGVVWDRTVDQDIGTPCQWPLRRPEDLDGYVWPDASSDSWYADIPARLAAHKDRFRVYAIGFSLFERAWTMRGMEDLLVDMVSTTSSRSAGPWRSAWMPSTSATTTGCSAASSWASPTGGTSSARGWRGCSPPSARRASTS